jgi:S-adenosylmethionine:tRNA ribosyltransferase-isomerase
MWGMKVSEFHFDLPEELVAQEALPERAASRLLVLDRESGRIEHAHVSDMGKFLRAGDVLVMNNSKVLPARLLGRTEKKFAAECFLLKRISDDTWEGLVRPGKKIEVGTKITCERDSQTLFATVKKKLPDGKVVIQLSGYAPVNDLLEKVGHMPLPPYIKRPDQETDKSRYQTVYAKALGSVAAPTAGLHFTPELLASLQIAGVGLAEITLHVGYGTFKPVRAENVEDHEIDPEVFEISEDAAQKINKALEEGRRVIAVGTTTTRTLESVAKENGGKIKANAGTSNLFIYPGFKFQVLSGLMTNFHLPESSLLMLVSAFAGKDKTLAAYGEAIKEKYRFYSYGDAMLII